MMCNAFSEAGRVNFAVIYAEMLVIGRFGALPNLMIISAFNALELHFAISSMSNIAL